jgi:trypsin
MTQTQAVPNLRRGSSSSVTGEDADGLLLDIDIDSFSFSHERQDSNDPNENQGRNLIYNEKTEEEQASFLEAVNPLSYILPHGHRANHTQYPYFVAWTDAFCGASLVWDDIVLTAAHCGVAAENPLAIKQVRLLSPFRKSDSDDDDDGDDDDEVVVRTIVYQETHPDYNRNLKEYDFQILKLDRSAIVDQHGNETGAAIVTLNRDYYHPAAGDDLQAVGFGSDAASDGKMVDTLLDVIFQTQSHDKCQDQYGPGRVPDQLMICMGVEGGGKDTCQGTVV